MASRYSIPYDNELRVSTREVVLFSGRFWTGSRGWSVMAAVQDFRRNKFYTYQLLLDLKVEAGLAIKIEPHPRFLHRPDRHRSDRSAGALEELVADDVLHSLQIASGMVARIFSGRASRCASSSRFRRIPTSNCLKWVRRRPPSENCSLCASTKAETVWARTANGHRRRTRYSTRLSGAFMARRKKLPPR